MPSPQDQDIWDVNGLPKPIQDNEDIVFVVRQDISFLIFKILQLVIFVIALLIARIILLGYLNSFWIAGYDMIFFGLNAAMILYFTLVFHNYYLSIQIVTNLRVIDIEQNGLFSRKANQLAVNNIENVTYRQEGLLASVLNFGDVIIETAGKQDPISQAGGFVFDQVPRPSEITEKLKGLNLQDRIVFAKLSSGAGDTMKDVINQRLREK
jgi:uncharacterized membrane protein YdbT with pleckstrin-like domain